MDLVSFVLDVFLAFFVLLSLAGWFSFNFVAFFNFCESSDFLSTTLGVPAGLVIVGVEVGVKVWVFS